MNIILQNYQAIVAILTVLSPVIIIYLTHWQTCKIRKIENDLSLQKVKLEKELTIQHDEKGKQNTHENILLSSLLKILFGVQKLHIDISCDTNSADCIDRSIIEFQVSLTKYQSIISDNQLYLPSQVINHLYRFYAQLANLLIELHSLKKATSIDLAIASVHSHVQLLANEVIEIQNILVTRRKELEIEFNKEQMKMMRYCCGSAPSAEVQARYESLKSKINIDPPTSLPTMTLDAQL